MKIGSSKVHRHLRDFVSLLLDLTIAGSAFLFAYVTIFSHAQIAAISVLPYKLLGFLASSLAAFLIFALFRGSWRYVSIPDLMTIVKGSLLAVLVYTVGDFLVTRAQHVPRSVPVLTFLYMVVGLVGARLAYRILVEHLMRRPRGGSAGAGASRGVLLLGLTDAAEGLIRAIRRDPASPLQALGIIDNANINLGRTVQGVRVLGNMANLAEVVERLRRQRLDVRELVVTEPNPDRQMLTTVLEAASALSMKVSRLPAATGIAEISSNLPMEPRPIELGDLLERPEVKADLRQVTDLIDGRVVLATGAGGSIGSELCRQIVEAKPARLVITDNCEFNLYTLDAELRASHPELDIVTRIMDVRNATRVARLFAEFQPGIVFHAAALKHVPLMEENPLEAVKTNILGTKNVADSALAARAAAFVLISTDKAVNPTNIMGATKRAAEAYCQSLDITSRETRFKTVRFGNVLGSNGSVVPRFEEQIATGGPVTVTHPSIVRYFMTIPEAVLLVLHASAHALAHKAVRGKIMVLDMGKPVRIVDLAERMIQLAGFKPRVDIDIVFTGLRPGEKLYEELFDPAEAPGGTTEDGYVVAAPLVIDRRLLDRTMAEIGTCIEREDESRAIELLAHLVPEFRRSDAAAAPRPVLEPEASKPI